MNNDIWKIADQLKSAARFLQNNAEDIVYKCIEDDEGLDNIELNIVVNNDVHKIVFTYHHGDTDTVWFEVKE